MIRKFLFGWLSIYSLILCCMHTPSPEAQQMERFKTTNYLEELEELKKEYRSPFSPTTYFNTTALKVTKIITGGCAAVATLGSVLCINSSSTCAIHSCTPGIIIGTASVCCCLCTGVYCYALVDEELKRRA